MSFHTTGKRYSTVLKNFFIIFIQGYRIYEVNCARIRKNENNEGIKTAKTIHWVELVNTRTVNSISYMFQRETRQILADNFLLKLQMQLQLLTPNSQ